MSELVEVADTLDCDTLQERRRNEFAVPVFEGSSKPLDDLGLGPRQVGLLSKVLGQVV